MELLNKYIKAEKGAQPTEEYYNLGNSSDS
jgi:hypothetical protein